MNLLERVCDRAGRPFAGVGPGSALGPGTAYTSPIMEPYPAALRFTCASHFTRPLLPTLEAPTCGRTGLVLKSLRHTLAGTVQQMERPRELVLLASSSKGLATTMKQSLGGIVAF